MSSGSDVDAVVSVEHISVHFRALQEDKASFATRLRHRKRAKRRIAALDDVSFEVRRGSVFSVIGPNGAGKSTLFRVVAGIIPPSEGRVVLRAQVTPLLSLGVGFNGKLTGRENIRLGGLASGLSIEQIEDRMEEIIEFSELGEAIDYPMRTYSSGMSSRLGFSVAAHLEPDLVLIDEALSAGDARFKEKAFQKVVDLCEADATVMLISHGLSIVRLLSEECLWLDDGAARMWGPTEEVVEGYIASQQVSREAVAMEDL